MTLDLSTLVLETPDWAALRDLFVELDFNTAARTAAVQAEANGAAPSAALAKADEAAAESEPHMVAARAARSASPATAPTLPLDYRVADSVELVHEMIREARAASIIAVDTETVLDPGAPAIITPMRANLVAISVATGPGKAWYLPFAHRVPGSAQGGLALDDAPAPTKAKASAAPASIAARFLAEGPQPVVNLPPLASTEMAPLRALLEDASVPKTAHNAKYDLLVLRRAGITLRGLAFDSMLASYVLDPSRRSHAIDTLAIEILGMAMPVHSISARTFTSGSSTSWRSAAACCSSRRGASCA